MQFEYIQELLRKAENGVLLDTNLFLVFLVGLHRIELVSKFKRTQHYTAEDFTILQNLVKMGGGLVTTPAILAETCNLCENLNRDEGFALFRLLSELTEQIKDIRKESKLICKLPYFSYLGFTDASVVDASKRKILSITDDATCFRQIEKEGGLGLNINHLRSAEWLGSAE